MTTADTPTLATHTPDYTPATTYPAPSYDALALNAILDSYLQQAAEEHLPQPHYMTLSPRGGQSDISLQFTSASDVHLWAEFHQVTCQLACDGMRVFHRVRIITTGYELLCYFVGAEHS